MPQRDAVALANSIEKLIKNPELGRSMGLAGRKKYLKEFTLQKFEDRLKGIFEEIDVDLK